MAELDNGRYYSASEKNQRALRQAVSSTTDNIQYQGPDIKKSEKFIQTVIGGIFTYQPFNTDNPNEVLSTTFFLQ